MTDEQKTLAIMADVGDITPRLAPEVLEEARRQRAHDAHRRAVIPPRLPESGHTLAVEVRSATIEGDEIHVALVIHGQVQRPEALATASEQVLHVKAPAKVERRST